jgi:hypothetical protein
MKITAFIASAILAYSAAAAPVVTSTPFENDPRGIQKHQIEDLPPISTFVTPGGFIQPILEYPQETTSTGLPFDSHPNNLETFPTIFDDIPGDGPKNQTNTTVSAQHRPASHSNLRGYNDTNISYLLDELVREYKILHAEKHSKRSDPQVENAFKSTQATHSLNSTKTSDDEMAQRITDQPQIDLKSYRTHGWKFIAPQLQADAIRKAENRILHLNITRAVALRHADKLRDLCHQVDGSSHRKASCAREVEETALLMMSSKLHQASSCNETANLLGKRAVSENTTGEVSPSQTTKEASHSYPVTQPSSVESSIYQFSLAYCRGESEYKLAEEFQDTTECALIHSCSKAGLERRQQDPKWLKKVLCPEQDNSIPWKRDGGNWGFEGSLNMEFESPKTHDTADVDFEVDWFSDWKRDSEGTAQPSAKQSVKRDFADQIEKLENEIGAEIKQFIDLKNATEERALDDVIQDAVERFAARVKHHKPHSSGKMNVTATFDTSNYRKRDISESVLKVESETAARVRNRYKYMKAPVYVLKNFTEGSDYVAHEGAGITSLPVGKGSSTTRLKPSNHSKRGLPESVRKLENEIGAEITKPFDEVAKPFTELKNSIEKRAAQHPYSKYALPATGISDVQRLFAELKNSTTFHQASNKTTSLTSGKHNTTSASSPRHTPLSIDSQDHCRHHSRDFKQSSTSLPTRGHPCHKPYPDIYPEDEFGQERSVKAYNDYIKAIAGNKYQEHDRYDKDKPLSGLQMYILKMKLMQDYDVEGFDPATAVPLPVKEQKKD